MDRTSTYITVRCTLSFLAWPSVQPSSSSSPAKAAPPTNPPTLAQARRHPRGDQFQICACDDGVTEDMEAFGVLQRLENCSDGAANSVGASGEGHGSQGEYLTAQQAEGGF